MTMVPGTIWAGFSEQDVTHIRFASMLAVFVCSVAGGFLSGARLGLSERWAKKMMTANMLFFDWPIALIVIWQMQLRAQLMWLPILGVVLMLVIGVLSTAVFFFTRLDSRGRLTLILAGALSNLGYTGGAFVCYALFGFDGLALANLYLTLWVPVVYLICFPVLKIHELHAKGLHERLIWRDFLDARCLIIPAVLAAFVLNLADIRVPAAITNLHVVDILVYVASALAFFSIGLRVRLGRLKNYTRLYLPLGAIKFLLTPAAAFGLLQLLALAGHNLTGQVRNVIMVLSAAPSAVLMVTMSNVFDLDGPLASAVWVVTTAVFAGIIVPLLFFVFA